jgi:hypothetical protein
MSESLRGFVLRGEVLKLYRSFLRTAQKAPPAAQGEVREQIRQGFEAHRGETDNYARKYLLSDGRAQLKQLRETLLMNE